METLLGFRLHSIAVAIGWLGSVISFFATVLLAVGLANIDFLVKFVMDKMNDNNVPEEAIRSGLIVVLSIYLTINIVNLVSSALLIAGTVKERHLLLVPWLLNAGFSVVMTALYMIIIVVVLISGQATFGAIIGPFITSALSFAIQYTIWSAIYSLFKQIRANREQQQLLMNSSNTVSPSYPSYTKL